MSIDFWIVIILEKRCATLAISNKICDSGAVETRVYCDEIQAFVLKVADDNAVRCASPRIASLGFF